MPQSETQTPKVTPKLNGGLPVIQAAPPLEFGEDFLRRPLTAQLEYLKKLAASQNQALDLMQKDRNKFAAQVELLTKQLDNANQAFLTQKEIAANLITQSNEEKQATNKRLEELTHRIIAQDKLIESLNGNID